MHIHTYIHREKERHESERIWTERWRGKIQTKSRNLGSNILPCRHPF